MIWQKQMQEVMTYIEDNLDSTIDYGIIAKYMKCSEGEFRRMFSFLSDTPLSDYIRNRRLTVAVKDIRAGKSITEVSNKYGYESQAAFSRAFKNFHGVSPSLAKNPNETLNACQPLTLKLVVIEGKTVMESPNTRTNIIGARRQTSVQSTSMTSEEVQSVNDIFWSTVGSDILGCTALPMYGAFTSEDNHGLFGDVKGQKLLEVGCGSGESLAYLGKRGAGELWGIDLSEEQISKSRSLLSKQGFHANLKCAAMEEDCGLPREYFDVVYSIYGIGWTTDLEGTIHRIHSYLKKDGIFIFSWSHPIHKCVSIDEDGLYFRKCYFDESQYLVNLNTGKLSLSDRKLSTYINALAKAGFMIEELIEESDEDLVVKKSSQFADKAKMLPVSFVLKARKV